MTTPGPEEWASPSPVARVFPRRRARRPLTQAKARVTPNVCNRSPSDDRIAPPVFHSHLCTRTPFAPSPPGRHLVVDPSLPPMHAKTPSSLETPHTQPHHNLENLTPTDACQDPFLTFHANSRGRLSTRYASLPAVQAESPLFSRYYRSLTGLISGRFTPSDASDTSSQVGVGPRESTDERWPSGRAARQRPGPWRGRKLGLTCPKGAWSATCPARRGVTSPVTEPRRGAGASFTHRPDYVDFPAKRPQNPADHRNAIQNPTKAVRSDAAKAGPRGDGERRPSLTDERIQPDARRASRHQPWVWGFIAALVTVAAVALWFGAADHLRAPCRRTQTKRRCRGGWVGGRPDSRRRT